MVPENLDCSLGGRPEQPVELRGHCLDRIEVRDVRRKVKHTSADCLTYSSDHARGEIVHDVDVTVLQSPCQLSLQLG